MATLFASMVDFADKFVDLVCDLAKWSQATFGSDSERGPMGPLRHLEKEARECQEAVGTPELIKELADCLLLLLDASRRAGVTPTQLVEAAQKKMIENKQRTWPTPTPDEPVEHVKSGTYESEGHKDRCALIGLLVSKTLDMCDASPNEIESRVDAMVMGLRIIE